MRILIADDDPIPRRLLESILQKWGYEVVVARDGQEAWDMLQQPDAPKLAILDWLMPGIDGVEVCRLVRQRPDAAYVYVILLTAKDQKEDVIAGMDAGADDYLIKPFDFYKLQVRLRAGRRILDLQGELLKSVEELERVRKREVEIGSRIQRTLLLGQMPEHLPGMQIGVLTVPSQQIDGDFYDFYQHSEHCLDMVVGDVMGKGVPAALFAAATKSQFLRALSHLASNLDPGALPQPEDIVSFVHAEMTSQFIGLESFETLCYARFDLGRQCIEFVDCGHTATIQYSARDNACRKLQGDNMPLGFSEREVYKQVSAPFEPGDVFFFYSDGVTEAQDVNDELFGTDRLTALVQTHGRLAPQDLVDLVRREVVAYSGAETFADDLTCVAVRIGKPPTAPTHVFAERIAHQATEVAGDLAELTSIWAFVRRFCQDLPQPVVDEDGAFHLELAVVEAASNIMKHAYEDRPDGRIQIEASAYTDAVTIQMYYQGEFFDPGRADPPAFDGTKESGFGLYIIAQSVDHVSYTQDEQGRTCIHLVQKRKDVSPES